MACFSRGQLPRKLQQPIGSQAIQGHAPLLDAVGETRGGEEVAVDCTRSVPAALQNIDERLQLRRERALAKPRENARPPNVFLEHWTTFVELVKVLRASSAGTLSDSIRTQ